MPAVERTPVFAESVTHATSATWLQTQNGRCLTDTDQTLTIGIDVGGTKIKAAIVNAQGKTIASVRRPSNARQGASGVIREITNGVHQLRQNRTEDIRAVGVGIAGQVEISSGRLLSSPNLDADGLPLKSQLQQRLDMDVFVTNDVRAAAFAEWQFGAARGVNDLICLFVGTGVGAGVVSGGRMLTGARSPAAELGHVPLVFQGRRCSCGNRGCLEAYVGGWAIAERLQQALARDASSHPALLLPDQQDNGVRLPSAEDLTAAFHDGDRLAIRLVRETAQYLAAAVAGMVNTFNPTCLVFGGGVMEGLPELLDTLRDDVQEQALKVFTEEFDIRRAELGGDAGCIGAAELARQFASAESTQATFDGSSSC